MKEMYLHCLKYNKWKKKEEFAKTTTITEKCEEPKKVNCGLCEFNKIEWVEADQMTVKDLKNQLDKMEDEMEVDWLDGSKIQ